MTTTSKNEILCVFTCYKQKADSFRCGHTNAITTNCFLQWWKLRTKLMNHHPPWVRSPMHSIYLCQMPTKCSSCSHLYSTNWFDVMCYLKEMNFQEPCNLYSLSLIAMKIFLRISGWIPLHSNRPEAVFNQGVHGILNTCLQNRLVELWECLATLFHQLDSLTFGYFIWDSLYSSLGTNSPLSIY